MKIKNIAILSILTITLFTGCEQKENINEDIVAKKTEQTNVQKQQKPVFDLTTSQGQELKIELLKNNWKFHGYEGKVILLDFFGTWCPPCKAEIPHLNNMREKLKKDFDIIGIDVGSRRGEATSPEDMAEFIQEFNIKYNITIGSQNGKLFGAVSSLNKSGSIPFMILFSKNGEYLKHYTGLTPEEVLFSDIKKAIEMK